MDDYYRARFKVLRPPRRATSWDVVHGQTRPPLPKLLRAVYVLSCVMSGLGWALTVAMGRGGGPLSQAPWLLVLAAPMPLAILFALGFSEDQRWTRPLLVAVLAMAGGVVSLAGSPVAATLLGSASVAAAAYLYGSSGCRRYYGFLRETAPVRLERGDLRSPFFAPLYGLVAASTAGAVLGYRAFGGGVDAFRDLDVYDAVSVVSGAFLGAIVLGSLGWCLGARWLNRHLAAG